MSVITFSCTACGQVLQVPDDKAGRKAKCVQCGAVLTIPSGDAAAAPPPTPQPQAASPRTPPRAVPQVAAPQAAAPQAAAPPAIQAVEAVPSQADLPMGARPPSVPPRRRQDDDEDADERRPRGDDRRSRDDDYRRRRDDDDDDYSVIRRSRSAWDKVNIGFLLAFIGLCVMAGALGLEIIGELLGMGGMRGALAFFRIAAGILFLGTVGAIVGHVFWLFVSNERNALAYAIATLAVAGVFLILQLVQLINVFNPFLRAYTIVLLIVYLLHAAHFLMIAFYLRALSQMLDDRALERSTMLLIILSACFGGYTLVTGVIILALPGTMALGRGYDILIYILRLLGSALTAVIYVFTLLAVFRGKELVRRA